MAIHMGAEFGIMEGGDGSAIGSAMRQYMKGQEKHRGNIPSVRTCSNILQGQERAVSIHVWDTVSITVMTKVIHILLQ